MLWDKTVFEMVLLHAYLSVRYNQGLWGSAPGPTRKPEDDPPSHSSHVGRSYRDLMKA